MTDQLSPAIGIDLDAEPLADLYDELLVAHHRLLHEHRCVVESRAALQVAVEHETARCAATESWLRESLATRERELALIHSSTSWRVTRPLRLLSGLITTVRRRLGA